MAYASRSGRARTSATAPAAFGVCDRCGMWYNLKILSWQLDWRGPILQNLRFLVCPPCYDKPQENIRTITLPADPVPVMNARVENFVGDSTDYRVTSGHTKTDPVTGLPVYHTVYRTTETGQNRTIGPYGTPNGLEQNAVMPWNGRVELGQPLSVLSVISNGTTVISVTCSKPHGLVNNSQVAVEGLSDVRATGFYSVCATTATAFTYDTYYPLPLNINPIQTSDTALDILTDSGEEIITSQSIQSASLLTSETLITTCLVGLPYGYAEIPQVGPGGHASVYVPAGTPAPPMPLTSGITTDDGIQITTDSGQAITVS